MPAEAPSPAAIAVRFASLLRRSGLKVPPDSVIAFTEALAALGLGTRQRVYWAGRATLVRRPEDCEVYDRLFARFFDRPAASRQEDATREPESTPGEAREPGAGEQDGAEDPEGSRQVGYSAGELLARKDFARYDEDEWDEARRLIDRLRVPLATRPSRRLSPSPSAGLLDLPRTMRAALSSDGEPVRRAWLSQESRPRRVVFVVDVSGSMEAYARAFLRLCHSWVVSRALGESEVFTIGTRLRRITRSLRWRDPEAALASVTRLGEDWYGGTRLGSGLKAFNDGWGSRGMARGAIVVVFSDGWDRGDPAEVAGEMERLHRLARRVVWVNPLKASPGYEPLARGMAAALPYVDDFVEGHSLASLERLAALVGGAGERKERA